MLYNKERRDDFRVSMAFIVKLKCTWFRLLLQRTKTPLWKFSLREVFARVFATCCCGWRTSRTFCLHM